MEEMEMSPKNKKNKGCNETLKMCNHIGTKKDRLPILKDWYYCYGCGTPFNRKHILKNKSMAKYVYVKFIVWH